MKRFMSGVILLIVIVLLNIPSGYAFELNGFADVSFTKCTDPCEGEEGRNGNFAFGTLDLYLAQTLEDIEILTELVVENGDILDLERLTIGYTFSDALRLRAGRFHTPLGFWNVSYHHGVQLQPTIDRPEFLKFEDDHGILPAHEIGLYLSGRIKTAAGAVDYGAIVGNGPKITELEGSTVGVLDPNNIEDNSVGKAVAFNLAISPEMVQGLKVGVSGHVARVQQDGDPFVDVDNADGDNARATGPDSIDVDQTILAASLTYSIGNIDFAGEYFSIRDKDKATTNLGSFTNNAYYGLLSYTYNDKWIPYLLFEQLSVKEADPYIIAHDAKDVKEFMVGLRYNITYRSSVKGEIRSVDEGNEDWNEYAVQWALAF